MAKLLQVGISFPHEMSSGVGHVACTLGGVNYESRGGRGCLRGSVARGAAHPLFRHRYHRLLSNAEAAAARAYADSCIGEPYVWGGVPDDDQGGDCSGFVSGIICAATGRRPQRRLFATGNWTQVRSSLRFEPGLGGAALNQEPAGEAALGVLDRPYPGSPVVQGSTKRNHVRWIQARLNFAAGGHHLVLDGRALQVDGGFGTGTLAVVVAFQKANGLQGLGMVGPQTWRLLNAVR